MEYSCPYKTTASQFHYRASISLDEGSDVFPPPPLSLQLVHRVGDVFTVGLGIRARVNKMNGYKGYRLFDYFVRSE